MAFDFSKFTPGIFKIKPQNGIAENFESSPVDNSVSFETYGFRQAGYMNGSTEGLKICLHRVFQERMAEMKRDDLKQEELRKPFKSALKNLLEVNEGLERAIKTISSEAIPGKQKKIDELKGDIADIRKHPENYTGNHVGKAAFYIGLIILFFLTVYLFVFYSSASYSALFKEFTPDDTVIAKAIFDARTFDHAIRDGLSELILILTIPAVFLGLGYLIHRFQERKGHSKYLKIVGLLLVTFIFDTIIAYEITEKIYEIKRNGGFDELPPYSFALAFKSVSFWLIIFAGFVVYVIWGFVFDFVMESYSNLDHVKTQIKIKQENIEAVEKEIQAAELKIGEMKDCVEKNNADMRKLQDTIDSTIIEPKEMKEALSQFMVGWIKWIANGRPDKRREHNMIYENFIAANIHSIPSIASTFVPTGNIN